MTEPFIGEIKMFAGNFAPRNYALCRGQLIAISQNEALFALLGTTYGGDGVQTFALPDLQGRVPISQGQGLGLTNRVQGEKSGTETVTLTVSQMPAHTHTVIATTVDATSKTPGGNLPARPSDTGALGLLYLSGSASGTDAPPLPASVSSAGGNQPHDNLMPFLGVNFIIALFGVFPSQN